MRRGGDGLEGWLTARELESALLLHTMNLSNEIDLETN